MSPRTGRPKSENPREEIVKARIDHEMCLKLDLYCEVNRISRSEAIRHGIELLLNEKK